MADNNQPQGNIRNEFNSASTGMNMDNSLNQLPKGILTYALNAAVENFDSNGISYQNEPSNEFCLEFPNNFVLIGKHFIAEKNKHIFFITNPETGDCEIGYMFNNDCQYHTIVSSPCLNFNINNPIHKVVHKITNCTTEIYWPERGNPRRYMNIDSPPWKLAENSTLCDPIYDVGNLDCNQLKLQPNFNIPEITVSKIISGGNLTAGSVQFSIQYSDASGNGYTSYYSVTNPCPIVDMHVTSFDFNYNVGKSVELIIDNLDTTGEYRYFNLAVIKTINNSISVNLVGTYSIDSTTKNITYSGEDVTTIALSLSDIILKHPYYEIAEDVTTVEDILVWKGLTSIDRINYQQIATNISLQWISYRLPAGDNYSNELNTINLKGYLRDEIYSFEIAFLLKNGKQTDSFHIPGREKNYNESYPDIPDTNPDFIGEPEYYQIDPITGKKIGYSSYWKIYNTASNLGTANGTKIGNATPFEFGDFAYWESTETYPCNENVWGELAGNPIRHHKFPDILVSPAFESASPLIVANKYKVEIQTNDAIFPLGVKVEINQIKSLIQNSILSQSQKDDIIGFKIVRGNRDTNKSIVAKGLLRNVGKYTRDTQDYYFPNYPYNDLTPDPYLLVKSNANNNPTTQNIQSQGTVDVWMIVCTADGEYTYWDPITGNIIEHNIMKTGQVFEFCSLGRPIRTSGGANIGPANYDGGTIVPGYNGFSFLEANAISSWSSTNASATPQSGYIFYTFFNYLPVGEIPTLGDGTPIHSTDTGYASWKPSYPPVFCDPGQFPPDEIYNGEIFTPAINRSRRSKITCITNAPITISDQDSAKFRQVFNSPETSFAQPFLGNILKLENVLYGAGKAHHVQVLKNAKYRLLSYEAQSDALTSCFDIAGMTNPFDMTAMFTAYQTYIQLYINGIIKKNYAYSYNSIASYDYSANIANDLGIKQRELDLKQYIIPVVQSVGDDHGINNYQRETSVYLKTSGSTPLPFPSKTPSLLFGNDSYIEDISRKTISDFNNCITPGKESPISVVSYYASLKNNVLNQWGQIYSYSTVDTGYQVIFGTNSDYKALPIFGGDTFISRFAFKTKLPFFIDNRVNAPDDSEIYYDELGNVGYPKYWHSARSILFNYQSFKNLISIKAHNFDCPNDPASIPPGTDNVTGTYRTFYDGYMYQFAYGVPNFYCESSYNTDYRQAFNNREGDFWPHVSTGIPDDWVQETFVPIQFDNTYHYNPTYSKQSKENYFSHLPADWEQKLCYTNYPFRAIYSDTQLENPDVRVNNWLNYSPTSFYDFPQNYGALTSIDGIQNRAILARFENKSLLYNTLLTVDTSNPQAAYLGNSTLFRSSPPVDFAETDLGYVGSQNKFLLKIPNGQVTIDAKRGQIFLIQGQQIQDLSALGLGMNRFFTDHLAFEILRWFPDVDTDNNFNGIGLHGVYDSKFDRIIITKLDYIPLDKDVKYDSGLKQFYIESKFENNIVKTQIYLTDEEFFCNKSWTLSFNINTKSWISFHSYIPNWYIGENNFYYSGLNGCCSDIEGNFSALVGDTNKVISTTTTTSTTVIPPLTTTTTTLSRSCIIEGNIIETNCNLEATAIMTVPPTPTTTLCQRPINLTSIQFISAYSLDGGTTYTEFISSYDTACAASSIIELTPDNTEVTLNTFYARGTSYSLFNSQPELNTILYNFYGTACDTIPDGWYILNNNQLMDKIYHVVDGILVEVKECQCSSTTTTTTLSPNVSECCGSIITETDNVYYNDIQNNTMQLIDIPGYTSSAAITYNSNYFWSISTDIKQWDISLSPFSATYNKTISFPIGYTNGGGIAVLNDTTIIGINDSVSPQKVVEINIDGVISTMANKFNTISSRTVIGNLMYTNTGKLLTINQDTGTSAYYLTQYNYSTGAVEYDIIITTFVPIGIYECECSLYVIDDAGKLWLVDKVDVTTFIASQVLSHFSGVISQVSNCSAAEIPVTTTTTTTL